MNIGDYVAMQVNGEAIVLREVLRAAKSAGKLGFLEELAAATLIRQAARQQGIVVSDDELQRAADDFRVARGLHRAEDLNMWLNTVHLTIEDWESALVEQVTANKLRDALVDRKVESYFAENKLSFDVAFISHIIVSNVDVAKELLVQVVEEGADFHALARQHSVDASTSASGGYVGPVKRKDLGAAALAAVFSGQSGQIAGPFKTSQGWRLIKIENVRHAVLDGATRENIKSHLFASWVAEQYSAAQISVSLLKEAGLEGEL